MILIFSGISLYYRDIYITTMQQSSGPFEASQGWSDHQTQCQKPRSDRFFKAVKQARLPCEAWKSFNSIIFQSVPGDSGSNVGYDTTLQQWLQLHTYSDATELQLEEEGLVKSMHCAITTAKYSLNATTF